MQSLLIFQAISSSATWKSIGDRTCRSISITTCWRSIGSLLSSPLSQSSPPCWCRWLDCASAAVGAPVPAVDDPSRSTRNTIHVGGSFLASVCCWLRRQWCKFRNLLHYRLIGLHYRLIDLHCLLSYRFGVIVAYVTNVTLQHGVENATLSARYAVEDTRTYLKSTSYHIRHLLVNNYGELKEHLFHTLDKTSDTVVTQLDKASNAVSLDQLHNIVEALPEVQQDLIDMDKITRDMQQKASALNDGELAQKRNRVLDFNLKLSTGLRGVKRELLNALQQCRTNECKQVQKDYEIGRLDENNIHYDQVSFPVSMGLLCCFARWMDSWRREYQLTLIFSRFPSLPNHCIMCKNVNIFMAAIGFGYPVGLNDGSLGGAAAGVDNRKPSFIPGNLISLKPLNEFIFNNDIFLVDNFSCHFNVGAQFISLFCEDFISHVMVAEAEYGKLVNSTTNTFEMFECMSDFLPSCKAV